MQQPEQNIPSVQPSLPEWTSQLTFHSTKISEPTIGDPELAENVDKFIELGSKVVISVSTAWWAICELLDYIKLRKETIEVKQNPVEEEGFSMGDHYSRRDEGFYDK